MPNIEEYYAQATETLDELLDIVGDDESHPLYDLLDTLSIRYKPMRKITIPLMR
jgi:hypothetical protein